MIVQRATLSHLAMVRMNPGDDLLVTLRDAVARETIANGVILSGVGSLSSYRYHVVEIPSLPTRDLFVSGEGPFDIVNVNGLVIDGRVHAHITFANAESAFGGHLEEGCAVLTFAAITIAVTDNAHLAGWDRVGPL